jgi:hypothetical protein
MTGEGPQETVQVGLDGTNDETELTTENATKILDALSANVDNG